MANISQIPRGHHRKKTKQVDYIRQKTDRKNLLKVIISLSDVNAGIYTESLEYSSLRNYGPSQHRHVTRLPKSRDASYSGGTTGHRCQGETRTSDVTSGTQSKAR